MLRLASLLVLALALAGCGTGGPAESSGSGNGNELFVEKCGGCHTLADAGTRGAIGPNLDNAFAGAREDGFEESSIREVVYGQVRYPTGAMPEPDSPQMFPPDKYTDEERDQALEAIANYVASVAGTTTAAAPGGTTTGQAADPKSLFTANCGSCHTLAAAGTQGTIGPKLDETQLEVAAIARQITNGGGGMPAFRGQLTNEQIQALARYVAENRGG